MPAGLNVNLTNPPGGQEPAPALRMASAHSDRRPPAITPLVLAALPEAGAPPLCASAIHKSIGFGSRMTVKHALEELRRNGRVVSELTIIRGQIQKRLYAKAPVADDFEASTLVYGDGEL
ncbi:MAG: hypothetical protein Q8M26_08930 [Pseudolabrys sp.]|nr:hypothetical protein [Pseudolabrys sp.]